MRRNYLNDYLKSKPSNENEEVKVPEADGAVAETPVVKAPDAEEGAPAAEKEPKEVSKEAPTDGATGEITPTDEGKVEQGEAGGPTKAAPTDGENGEIAPTGDGEIKAEATPENAPAAKADAPTGEIVAGEEGKIDGGSPKVDVDVTEVEFEVVETALKETEAAVKDDQEIKATAEALEGYATELRLLLSTESYTTGTARILENAINTTLSNLGTRENNISLESHGIPLSVKGKHEHMLERVSMEANVLHDVAQGLVMQFKHHWNAQADFFRTVNGQAKKYEAKIEQGIREFEGKKDKFRGSKVTVGMTELWYHFSTEAGKVKDVVGAVTADVALSKYILVEYTNQILQTASKLGSICQTGNLSTPEGIAKLVQQLEGIKHPADLFNQALIKGKSYLSVTHLDVEAGKARKPIDFNGKPLVKLAELATPKKVIEAGSGMHTAKKIGAYAGMAAANSAVGGGLVAAGVGAAARNMAGLAVNAAGAAAAGDFTMNVQDIGKVLNFGREYLHYVEQYSALESKFEQVGNATIKAIAALGKTATESVGKQVVKQIDDFATMLLFQNFANPAHAEIRRAIKGAKYCHYLALRAIYNAERVKGGLDNKAPAQADGAAKGAVNKAPAGKPVAPTKK